MPGIATLPSQFGRYRVLRKLGQGGMGAVYLAMDSQLDREVALKIPSLGESAHGTVVDRFMREARLAAKLVHPNLCPIFDVGSHAGVPYYTMPFLKGETIAARLRQGPFPPKQAAALVQRIALGMHEAHKQGIIHRDLKPANIMIDERKQPIVMDFGLAQRAQAAEERITKPGGVVGTPVYMAPEQLDGDPAAIGPACDIYALGMVFYEMLTGTVPFEGPLTVLIGQIVVLQPKPPSVVLPGLEATWDAICQVALAKAPKDRHASMADFAKAIGFVGKTASSSGSVPVLPSAAEAAPQAAVATHSGSVEETFVPRRGPGSTITRLVRPRGPAKRHGVSVIALGGLVGVMAVVMLLAALFLLLRRDPPAAEEQVQHRPLRPTFPVPLPRDPPPTETAKESDQANEAPAAPPSLPRRPPPETPPPPWTGHRTQPRCVAVARDGKTLVTGGDEGDFGVYLWDAATGALLHRFDGHTEIVRTVAITADGQFAVSAGGGRYVQGLPERGVQDSQVRLWNLRKRRLERLLGEQTAMVHAVAISPDGNFIVAAGDTFTLSNATGTLAFWNLQKNQRYAVPSSGGLGSGVRSLAFSPDGQWLVAGTVQGLSLLDTKTWTVQREWVPDHPMVLTVAVDGPSERLAVGTASGHVSLWDLQGRRLATLTKHGQFVGGVEFFPENRRLLSIGADRVVKVHDLRTRAVLGTWNADHHLQGGVLSADGRRAFTFGHSPTLEIWDMPAHVAADRGSTDAPPEKEKPAPTPEKPRPFVPLLRGGMIDAAWVHDGGDQASFGVENGALVCQGRPPPRQGTPEEAWLLTRADYGDFILRGQVAILAGADSGICFRAQPGMSAGTRAEINFLDEALFRPAAHDGLRFGALWNETWLDRRARQRGYGQWNDFQIELRGDRLKVVINGQAVLDGDLAARAKGQPRPWLTQRRGRVGFQALYGVTRYRQLELQDLEPSGR